MNAHLKQFLQEKLSFHDYRPPGKVMDLSEAVKKFIQPGMSIQFGNGMTTPTAIFLKSPVNSGEKIPASHLLACPAALIIWLFLRMVSFAKKFFPLSTATDILFPDQIRSFRAPIAMVPCRLKTGRSLPLSCVLLPVPWAYRFFRPNP